MGWGLGQNVKQETFVHDKPNVRTLLKDKTIGLAMFGGGDRILIRGNPTKKATKAETLSPAGRFG